MKSFKDPFIHKLLLITLLKISCIFIIWKLFFSHPFSKTFIHNTFPSIIFGNDIIAPDQRINNDK
ncbi:MAG: hypothetical protein JWM09_1021 [Francisellaceae bacterium]|nr:hypothetical protein [Francisellaceae bacterium]